MKKRITFTFDEELINYLKEVSEKTMIPQSRLAEQAIKEYLDKIKATKNQWSFLYIKSPLLSNITSSLVALYLLLWCKL